MNEDKLIDFLRRLWSWALTYILLVGLAILLWFVIPFWFIGDVLLRFT